jgi:hypothetical protein
MIAVDACASVNFGRQEEQICLDSAFENGQVACASEFHAHRDNRMSSVTQLLDHQVLDILVPEYSHVEDPVVSSSAPLSGTLTNAYARSWTSSVA